MQKTLAIPVLKEVNLCAFTFFFSPRRDIGAGEKPRCRMESKAVGTAQDAASTLAQLFVAKVEGPSSLLRGPWILTAGKQSSKLFHQLFRRDKS